jgi:hypothetical protein
MRRHADPTLRSGYQAACAMRRATLINEIIKGKYMDNISDARDRAIEELRYYSSQYKDGGPSQFDDGRASPRLTSRQADSVVGDLEFSSTATKLGLFNFLLAKESPQPYASSTTGSSDSALAIRRAREKLQDLQKLGTNVEDVRQEAARKLQASLPTYLFAEDASKLAPLPAVVLEKMPLAQAAGAKVAEEFVDHGPIIKLKLLGYSLASEWRKDIEELGRIYEKAKAPFNDTQVLGFAFKEAFNEILINQFPDNQKQYFNRAQSNTKYADRKAAILLGIHIFIEDPKTEMDLSISMPHSDPVSESATASSSSDSLNTASVGVGVGTGSGDIVSPASGSPAHS